MLLYDQERQGLNSQSAASHNLKTVPTSLLTFYCGKMRPCLF